MKARVRSTIGFRLEKKDVEKSGGISQTVADDSFTIRELLEKYTQGLDPGVAKNPVYDSEDMDFDDFDRSKVEGMDPVDRQELVDSMKEKASRQLDLLKEIEAVKAEKEKGKPAPAGKPVKPNKKVNEDRSDEEPNSEADEG